MGNAGFISSTVVVVVVVVVLVVIIRTRVKVIVIVIVIVIVTVVVIVMEKKYRCKPLSRSTLYVPILHHLRGRVGNLGNRDDQNDQGYQDYRLPPSGAKWSRLARSARLARIARLTKSASFSRLHQQHDTGSMFFVGLLCPKSVKKKRSRIIGIFSRTTRDLTNPFVYVGRQRPLDQCILYIHIYFLTIRG